MSQRELHITDSGADSKDHGSSNNAAHPDALPLYQRLASGQERAFNEAHHSYKARLTYYLLDFSLSIQEIEEVVSDAFLNLWRARAQLRSDIHVKNLLYFAARNKALQLIASKDRMPRSFEDIDLHENELTEKSMIGAAAIEADMLQLLQEAIGGLPPDCRKIFELYYYQEKNTGEIAHIMEIGTATVRSQKRRAIQLLRAWIAKRSLSVLFLACLLALLLFFSKKIDRRLHTWQFSQYISSSIIFLSCYRNNS